MIRSYTQLLARRYKGRLDGEADEFIGFVEEAAARMQQLITDLLAYSRVGREGKEFGPVDCETCVARALANLRVVIEESKASVAHSALPRVFADDTQLTQLFQNLIGNALKYRTQDAPRVEVRAERNGTEWLLAVSDNGIGIAPEQYERIFGMFQRLHGREEYPGTGIGLAICKKIVDQHGGRIWVASQPGKGTTFFFTLPAIKDTQ
jgi:light-regulated signal transduction histidine kinase (bacteriophytochrome)